MALTPDQRRDLNQALSDAFRTVAELERLSDFYLDINLHEIIPTNTNLNQVIFSLIDWCNRHDRIDSLLKGALELNSGNPLLKRYVQKYMPPLSQNVLLIPISKAQTQRDSPVTAQATPLQPELLLKNTVSDGQQLLSRIRSVGEKDHGEFIEILRDTKQWEENIISRLALPPLAVLVREPYRPLEFPNEMFAPQVFLLYVEDLSRKLQNQIDFLERILVFVASQAISNPTPNPRKDKPIITPVPKKLIMKGGGILGLAYASAIQELEHYYKFDTFVGTSAGAIVACLLGAGHSGSDLCQILSDTDFAELLDNKPFKAWWSGLRNGYMHSGLNLENWLIRLIHRKTNLNDPTLSEVARDERRIVMFASRVGHGGIAFDSEGQESDRRAAFVVRCSMSVPGFFESQTIDGDRVYDGGLRNNFPVKAFIEIEDKREVNIRPHFIALFLGTSEPQERRKRSTLDDVTSILLEGEDRILMNEYPSQTIIIDPSPIGFLKFKLTPDEKRLLVAQGRAAALRFLQEQNLPNGPENHRVINAIKEAEKLKQVVIKQRPFWSR